jgi:ATP phosphoribosyltransferase
LLASAADVIGACERGALDAGVAGKDALLEADPEVHELLDLRTGRDALVYAARRRPPGLSRRVRPRVATRYARVAQTFFAEAGEQADVFAFDSPALAVRLGLADGVVELRGRLDAGGVAGLQERAEVALCSARLVCGRAARTLAGVALEDLVERLRARMGQA